MCMIHVLHYWLLVYVMDGHWAQLWTDKVGLVGQITVRKYKLLVTFTGWIPKTFPGVISMLSQLHDVYQTNPAFIKEFVWAFYVSTLSTNYKLSHRAAAGRKWKKKIRN